MTIPDDTLAWLRQAAAAGQADAQVMQELLRRIEALEQRPIAGGPLPSGATWIEREDKERFITTPPAPTAEDSSVTTPPDAEDEPQTLHSVALQMVDTLARLRVIPQILDTLRRAIREPMATAATAGPVATDQELYRIAHEADSIKVGFRIIYDLGREHAASQASCPHIRSSDEGTSYCNLAEQGNSSVSLTGSPAPAGGLVERLAIACAKPCNKTWDDQARAAIREVAAWLRKNGSPASAHNLELEAARQEAQSNG